MISVQLHLPVEITIHNIYIPPVSSCSNNYNPSIAPLLTSSNTLVLGDFNAHDPLWHSSLSDARGDVFAAEIDGAPFATINSNSPTRCPPNARPTSPDISLASADLLDSVEWKTLSQGPSDHLPILIRLAGDSYPWSSKNRTFVNYRKADWPLFALLVDKSLVDADALKNDNIFSLERTLRSAILDACK